MKPTQEQVIAWAREVSGVEFPISTKGVKIGMSPEHLERFAALAYEAGAAAEREGAGMKCERCGEANPAEIHTCSPQRGWQGLTDDEAEQIADLHWDDPDMFIQAIEDVLRRKNS